MLESEMVEGTVVLMAETGEIGHITESRRVMPENGDRRHKPEPEIRSPESLIPIARNRSEYHHQIDQFSPSKTSLIVFASVKAIYGWFCNLRRETESKLIHQDKEIQDLRTEVQNLKQRLADK